MFHAPIYFCDPCHEYVALDQSPEDCISRNGCKAAPCPLSHLFARRGTAGRDVAEPCGAAPMAGFDCRHS